MPAKHRETYVPLFIARRSAERPRGCLKKVLFENPKINLAAAQLAAQTHDTTLVRIW